MFWFIRFLIRRDWLYINVHVFVTMTSLPFEFAKDKAAFEKHVPFLISIMCLAR